MLHASPFNAQVASLPSGLKGGRLVLALPEASIARHDTVSKRQACVAGCGSGALRITGTARLGDVRLLKTSSRLLFTGLAGPYASN